MLLRINYIVLRTSRCW